VQGPGRFELFRAAPASGPLSRPLPRKQRGREVTRTEASERFGDSYRIRENNTGRVQRNRQQPEEQRNAFISVPLAILRSSVIRFFSRIRYHHQTQKLVAAGSNSPLISRVAGERGRGRGGPVGRSGMPAVSRYHRLRTRTKTLRSGIEFSPFSRAAGERGRGRGGPVGRSGMPAVVSRYHRLRTRTKTLRSGIEFSPFSRAAGERGPCRMQWDASRRASVPSASDACKEAWKRDRILPSPRGTSGEGPGGQPTGRVTC
jgi:hypothetical protein